MNTISNNDELNFGSLTSTPVFLSGCLIPVAVIAAEIILPALAPELLSRIGNFSMAHFNYWVLFCIAGFLVFCTLLATIPRIGKRKLGRPSDKPEFSVFSWFSMIVSSGIGISMLTWGVTEPIAGMQSNPDVIRGITDSESTNNISAALKWSYTQWGLSAWAIYSLVGLAIAYTGLRQNLPLTLSTALTPLLGKCMRGKPGSIVDAFAVTATILCAIQTLGYALDESVISFARATDFSWLVNDDGNATIAAKLAASTLIVTLGAASALSGLHKGVKWLSNINVLLSLLVLATMLIAGSFTTGIARLAYSVFDYLINLPEILLSVWSEDGTRVGNELQQWQGTWVVFHWFWWLAFSPFVGVFLARISRGRTVREYVLFTVVLPALFCMIWMSIAGGNALQLELNAAANESLFDAPTGHKIFLLVQHLFVNEWLKWLVSSALVILLITYLATTIDSMFIVVTTLANPNISSSAYTSTIIVRAALLITTTCLLVSTIGFYSVRGAMVAAAVPICGVIVLLCISLTIAIYNDRYGSPSVVAATNSGAL